MTNNKDFKAYITIVIITSILILLIFAIEHYTLINDNYDYNCDYEKCVYTKVLQSNETLQNINNKNYLYNRSCYINKIKINCSEYDKNIKLK